MSLGIVLLTDEGLVLASESLGTLMGIEHQKLNIKCKCGHEGEPNMACPKCEKLLGSPPPLSRSYPASHTYHCQKLFKISKNVGLIIVGSPEIGPVKAQQFVSLFIEHLEDSEALSEIYAEAAIDKLKALIVDMDILKTNPHRTELILAGLQAKEKLVPYAKSIIIEKDKIHDGIITEYGMHVAGVHDILDKMFGDGGIQRYPIRAFPLQDSVEFAEFLLQTQIGVDKYTAIIPRVGGEIDIAVIHPNSGFKWVKQKYLQKILEED